MQKRIIFRVMVSVIGIIALQQCRTKDQPLATASAPEDEFWIPPDTSLIPHSPQGELIRYGRALIANTAFYFGPRGILMHGTNGMNCQNCHLDAGARPFANNFAVVASGYPKYRDRSGRVESVEFRINECLERSLNGKKIDSASREMKAMVAYMNWVGQGIGKGKKPMGAGAGELAFLGRAADTAKGRIVYQLKCQTCHGMHGEGLPNADKTGYTYPPLWGGHSYNVSAGLYRIGKFAAYVKSSMPLGSTAAKPQLTDEEAWDVAAFVNAQPHPRVFFSYDWPKPETKPVDYPFGPYTDGFSEMQHKYGPFGPIQQAKQHIKH